MSFTPYDWNQSIQTRAEYVEQRLRDGSPVVGLSIDEGVLLLTIHRTQRKIYEIYDRLLFGGIGNQSDVEAMRNAAIDFAHREGFQRSPDDVTAQRLVGSVLSPALKQAFGDPFTAPFLFRGLFAELGAGPDEDVFFALGYDGEFKRESRYSVVAGSFDAENRMIERLHESVRAEMGLAEAVRLGMEAWALGKAHTRPFRSGLTRPEPDEEIPAPESLLREELASGTLEVGLLDRRTPRESKFRLLGPHELAPALTGFDRG